MNQLTQHANRENGSLVTSLELVAEINLFRNEEGNRSEIRHDSLLATIRDEFEEEISLLKILESDYTNERGRTYPMFVLTKSQATQILARESKFVRKAIIAKLEKLETQTPLTPEQQLAQAVLLAQSVIAQKDEQIKLLAPKADYADVVLRAEGCHTVTSIAKELGMSGRELNRQLCEAGVQYRHRDCYVLYAKYQNKGYTETETHPYFNSKGEVMVAVQMVWTEYGRVFVHSLFNSALSFSKTYNMEVAVSQMGGVSC